jgi:hypothetical protein
VLLDRALGDDERVGDRWFERPSAMSPSTSRSRGLSSSSGSSRRRRPSSARDDLGVERAAALAHAPDGVDEALEVGDAVLEQVADASALLDRSSSA